jgi:hypothetical protein
VCCELADMEGFGPLPLARFGSAVAETATMMGTCEIDALSCIPCLGCVESGTIDLIDDALWVLAGSEAANSF